MRRMILAQFVLSVLCLGRALADGPAWEFSLSSAKGMSIGNRSELLDDGYKSGENPAWDLSMNWWKGVWGAGFEYLVFNTREENAHSYGSYSITRETLDIDFSAMGISLKARYPGSVLQPYLGVVPLLYTSRKQSTLEYLDPGYYYYRYENITLSASKLGVSFPIGMKIVLYGTDSFSVDAFGEYRVTLMDFDQYRGRIYLNAIKHVLYGLSISF